MVENQVLSQQPQQQHPNQDYQQQPYPQQSPAQPAVSQNEPGQGAQPQPSQIPGQPIKKKSAFVAFFGFIILLFLGVMALGVFILMSAFMNFSSGFSYYAAVAVVSLAAGALIGLIAKELIQTDKGFLWGCSLVSFIVAGLVSTVVKIQLHLSEMLAELSKEAAEANVGGAGILSMFSPPSNPLITSLVIIMFFNIPVLAMFFRMKERKIWHLVIYLLPIIIFLAIFYLLPGFILQKLPQLLEGFQIP